MGGWAGEGELRGAIIFMAIPRSIIVTGAFSMSMEGMAVAW